MAVCIIVFYEPVVFEALASREVVIYIKLSVFVVIIAVRLGDGADHAAGISGCDDIGRNVFCHNTACPDHGIVTDGNTGHNADISAEPDVIADRDRDSVFIA